jgi:hypothetical protein
MLFCSGAKKSELSTQALSVAGFISINRVLVFPRDLGTPTLDWGHVNLPSGEIPEDARKQNRVSRASGQRWITPPAK